MNNYKYILRNHELMKIVAANNNVIIVEKTSKKLTKKIARKACDYYQAQQLGYALFERWCFAC